MRNGTPVRESILGGDVATIDGEGPQNFRDLSRPREARLRRVRRALDRGEGPRELPLKRRKQALRTSEMERTGIEPATRCLQSCHRSPSQCQPAPIVPDLDSSLAHPRWPALARRVAENVTARQIYLRDNQVSSSAPSPRHPLPGSMLLATFTAAELEVRVREHPPPYYHLAPLSAVRTSHQLGSLAGAHPDAGDHLRMHACRSGADARAPDLEEVHCWDPAGMSFRGAGSYLGRRAYR